MMEHATARHTATKEHEGEGGTGGVEEDVVAGGEVRVSRGAALEPGHHTALAAARSRSSTGGAGSGRGHPGSVDSHRPPATATASGAVVRAGRGGGRHGR
jgi:hypothetical protein